MIMTLAVKVVLNPNATNQSKFLFSENGRRRALIFGMQHHLVDLYQVCSYDALVVKTGPASGVTSLNITKKAKFKILLL